MIHHRLRRPALLAVIAAVALAGCSGSDADDATPTTAPSLGQSPGAVPPAGACGGELERILSEPVPAADDFECDGSISFVCGSTLVVAIGTNADGVEVNLAGTEGATWSVVADSPDLAATYGC